MAGFVPRKSIRPHDFKKSNRTTILCKTIIQQQPTFAQLTFQKIGLTLKHLRVNLRKVYFLKYPKKPGLSPQPPPLILKRKLSCPE